MPCYQIGSYGDEVKQIQTRLSELGFYRGPLDGSYGGGTAAAVKAFQQSQGLVPTGEVGPESWAKIAPGTDMPQPAILSKGLDYRCLALTGGFETGTGAPDCFCALSGDFDGQGISFGVLQWNFGQGSLQPLLNEFIAQHPQVAKAVFQDDLNVVVSALAAPIDELMQFVRSIQHPVNRAINEPWRGMAKALGRTPEYQALQVKFAGGIFKRALAMAKEYGLKTERGVMLMFDICVQNGSISNLIKSRITTEFNRLPNDVDEQQNEVRKMQIIANLRAEAGDPRWVEDIRARKLTIANGEGRVHGVSINLQKQFGITLAPV